MIGILPDAEGRMRRAGVVRVTARIADTWPDEDDVYVYFNNDLGGAAVVDAAKFARTATALGRTVTRTPPPSGTSGTGS